MLSVAAKNRELTETVTLTRHGHTYTMRVWPGKIAACMRAGRPYEEEVLEYVYGLGLSGHAVDVGANLGNHTLWFAVMCGLRVTAFEPICHRQLKANVDLNGLAGQVRVVPVALGSNETTAVHDRKSKRWGKLKVQRGSIPVRRLDRYKLTGVSLLKIDVEGMEPRVLRGGQKTIMRNKPVILAEAWGRNERKAIASVIHPWGYQRTMRFASADIDVWMPAS